MSTDKPIYLPDTMPAYPGRDGTREGARRAAVAAMRQKPTQPAKKRGVNGIDAEQGEDAALGPMFAAIEE